MFAQMRMFSVQDFSKYIASTNPVVSFAAWYTNVTFWPLLSLCVFLLPPTYVLLFLVMTADPGFIRKAPDEEDPVPEPPTVIDRFGNQVPRDEHRCRTCGVVWHGV